MKHLLLILTLLTASLALQAQKNGSENSYNYARAEEAYDNGDAEQALHYLQKAIEENPKDADAYLLKAAIYYVESDYYGEALSNVNSALKYIPKKDKEWQATAWELRFRILWQLDRTDDALADVSKAISLDPDEIDYYQGRGELLYYLERYDESDKDFRQMIAMDDGNTTGYMGLARNAIQRGDNREAINQLDQVVKLDPEFAQAHSFLAEAYFNLKDYNAAADQTLTALKIDNSNSKAMNMVMFMADSVFPVIKSKLDAKILQDKDNLYWKLLRGTINEQTKHYTDAIADYQKVFETNPHPELLQYIARCYDELYQPQQALLYIDQALAMDSTSNSFYYVIKADAEFDLGLLDQAIHDYNRAISVNEGYDYYCHYKIGWAKEIQHNYEAALQNYSASISIAPEYAYTYYMRGSLLKGIFHKTEEAEEDFRKVLELDTAAINGTCRQFALLELGKPDEAISWMDKILQNDTTNAGNYYDAACLYTLLQDTTQALDYFQRAFQKGFLSFVKIDNNRNLDFIRDLPSFRQLLEQYRPQAGATLLPASPDTATDRTLSDEILEIPFTPQNGVCKVQCKINGLPLHFIFDTGASDVTMSTVEATFMLKNGYLTPLDIRNRQNYITADGSIIEGTIINLRRVELGNLTLDNIQASIVQSQNAPLLLGQSVLGRLGKIEIDNGKRVLKITPWKK